jgi:hypothetical protein
MSGTSSSGARKGPAPRRRTSALLIGILAVLTAVLVIIFVLRLAKAPGAKVQLGTSEFEVGRATALAKPIDRDGPLLFQALRGGSLDIFVQHLGADPAQGWRAFEAHAARAARSCQIQWQRAAHDFMDPCSRQVYPPDGQGLTQYAATVLANGRVVVDLRQPAG